jgi:hypothetical protein
MTQEEKNSETLTDHPNISGEIACENNQSVSPLKTLPFLYRHGSRIFWIGLSASFVGYVAFFHTWRTTFYSIMGLDLGSFFPQL